MPPQSKKKKRLPAPQIILVTGANKGLGLSIIQVVAQRESPTPRNTCILCSRDIDAGQKAAQELRAQGYVTGDEQIAAAVKYVEETYGRLDVLINNAGTLITPPNTTTTTTFPNLPTTRQSYNAILNLHITSIALTTLSFTALLHQSPSPKVINISSDIASMQNVLTATTNAPRHPPYAASKIGMNGLTVHMQVSEDDRVREEGAMKPRIRFYAVAPGPLKTGFNGFSGPRAPEEGAEVVVRLVRDEGVFEGGMRVVPW
ncbi:NAD(P)-binding protein [Aspergillus heteromorphus CBS 117.55]|uniref:NAD(P)-binding protein n=1 Tax=Aspergillus heteromorphus CBS 117.55 TaxID=1448321 RepID=A0A317W3S6_9EURO|nr:NAD(P)-binding protein [Aspergillus heteromorphus CBS 117.55]PWY80569.1 NAD(P)-binding protein [Aspergillus heteromorphus CBS 117.55]